MTNSDTSLDAAVDVPAGTMVTPEVPCLDMPCGDCGRPRLLDPQAGFLACGNIDCPDLGLLAPVWRELDALIDAGAPDPCPGGWPRPRSTGPHAGLPVPWLTPVAAAAGPLWRLVHGRRLAHAQDHWVCQVCGEPCEPAAVLIVDGAGRCRTSARCTAAGASSCRRRCARHRPLRQAPRPYGRDDQNALFGDPDEREELTVEELFRRKDPYGPFPPAP